MMQSALRTFLKSVYHRVRRDNVTGHLYYIVDGKRVHVRSADDCERQIHRQFAFNHIYFGHYRPSGSDCVVDFGAGFGAEIVSLAAVSPALRYVAVEIQPWVYECLALTLAQLPAGFTPYALAVGEGESTCIAPTRAGIDASTIAEGQVPVEMVSWAEFVRRHGIAEVDLLKMNIEGGEAPLLEHIDLDRVKRVIVSVHDFRADRGEGEHFRTRSRVEARLKGAGFELAQMDGDEDWIRSWLYASRPGL